MPPRPRTCTRGRLVTIVIVLTDGEFNVGMFRWMLDTRGMRARHENLISLSRDAAMLLPIHDLLRPL